MKIIFQDDTQCTPRTPPHLIQNAFLTTWRDTLRLSCSGLRVPGPFLTVPIPQVQPHGHQVHCLRQWSQPSEGLILHFRKWNLAAGAGCRVLRECWILGPVNLSLCGPSFQLHFSPFSPHLSVSIRWHQARLYSKEWPLAGRGFCRSPLSRAQTTVSHLPGEH